jgi:TolB-like protein
LIASVWGGRIVSDSTLTSRINAARKAVGDSGVDRILIRTVARKGPRFVGDVRVQSQGVEQAQATGPAPVESHEPPRPPLPLPDRPAIAVLPFTNMSGDPEQEYFSDGISEDLITALSKLRWFFVIARNSSFIYKGKSVHMKQIAEELGVSYVVEGSVRKGGDRVCITAQLNDVATGSHIWAEHYDRELADVFVVQDEITEAIVAAIEPAPFTPFGTGSNLSMWKAARRTFSNSSCSTSPWAFCEPCSSFRRNSSFTLSASCNFLSFSISFRRCSSSRSLRILSRSASTFRATSRSSDIRQSSIRCQREWHPFVKRPANV